MNDRNDNEKTKFVATKDDSNIVDVRSLSENELKALGVSQMAYIKVVMINGEQAFAIHAADGTPMAITDNIETASAAIVQYEMTPILVN